METIASFSINHDLLEKGMYISRIDGDVVTYDIRMKKPNMGDYLSCGAMHSFEHLFATYVRNTRFADKIVYVGPMGCRTGFYFLVRDSLKQDQALQLVKDCFRFIAEYEGEIPGSKRVECGKYREHDLDGAKQVAEDMCRVLSNWTVEDMIYRNE